MLTTAKFAMTDCRVVTFWPHTLASVMEHTGQVLGYMPPGAVHGVELLPDEQLVRFDLGPEIDPVRLGGSQLAALLIGYCTGARIPLPMTARKRLVVDEQHVRIEFVICYPELPRYQRDDRFRNLGGDTGGQASRMADGFTPARKRAHEW